MARRPVRGQWVWRRGQRIWREWAPKACPDGHEQLMPGWGKCPDCGAMGRYWLCQDRECGRRVTDPDHQCSAT